jgi:DNA-binding FrmR family transcriptional regulator
MPPEARTQILQRFRSAQGHIKAVIDMLEANAPCEQVLHQLGAVQAALRVAEAQLLACQVEFSSDVIKHSVCPEKRVAELNRLRILYQMIIKNSK